MGMLIPIMYKTNQEKQMNKLDVLFAKKQHLQLSDISEQTGMSKSMIARAAMQLGIKAIKAGKNTCGLSIHEVIAIEDAKARN